MNQHKNLILKTIALFLVLFVIVIPALPSHNYKKVQATAVVDPRVFNAVLASIGGTAIALSLMSNNFSIPANDFEILRSNFQTSLQADPDKLANWTKMQTDYLAKGMVYTATATELAKAGVVDVYNNFLTYLKTKTFFADTTGVSYVFGNYTVGESYYLKNEFTLVKNSIKSTTFGTYDFGHYLADYVPSGYGYSQCLGQAIISSNDTSNSIFTLSIFHQGFTYQIGLNNDCNSKPAEMRQLVLALCNSFHVNILLQFPTFNTSDLVFGTANY
ncbi:MAG TPA: hypothetical protein VIK86_02120, partial [Candidatus Paceibacterota bacterium]